MLCLREATSACETGTCILFKPSLCPLEAPGQTRRAYMRHLWVTDSDRSLALLRLSFLVCPLSQAD